MSQQDRMFNALKNNFSPHPVSKYGKLAKQAPHRHYQANRGDSGQAADQIQALGVLRRTRAEKKLAAEK
jgi:hypothetical protein